MQGSTAWLLCTVGNITLIVVQLTKRELHSTRANDTNGQHIYFPTS